MPPPLNLLKKLKPRAKPPPKIKARERKKKALEPKKADIVYADIFKINPYKVFATIPIEDLDDAIDKWMFKLNSMDNRLEINMFNIIKNRIPWTKVRPFFVQFAENAEPNILKFFHKYKSDIKVSIMRTKKLLEERKAISLGPYVEKEEVYIPKYKAKLPKLNPPIQRRYETKFVSQCEKDYKKAPWVQSTSPIIGVVLNINFPDAKRWTTPRIINNEWAIVKTDWYTNTCYHGRPFIPGFVGYLSNDGQVIEETKEIYDSIYSHEVEDDDVVNDRSINAATILLNYAFPDMNVNEIITKLPKTSNEELAKTVSWLVVFMSKLINQPQIYHNRIKKGRYVPGDIVTLTKYDMLPEVYENPNFTDREQVNDIITSKRKDIEADFNDLRKSNQIERAKFNPKKQKLYKYPSVKLPPECKNIEDPIYFKENDKMYCLDRKLIIDVDINPYTGAKIPDDIKRRARQLKDLTRASSKLEEEQRELAPGLFNALEEEIDTLYAFEPIYCDQCDKEVVDPRFKSFKGGKKVEFCSTECFDKYKFKDK
jgi:hypothetical protein